MTTRPLGLPASIRPGPRLQIPSRRPSQPTAASLSPSSSSSSSGSWRRGDSSSGYTSPATSIDEFGELGHKSVDATSPSPAKDYVVGSLWSRVTAAAGTLSVNVARAWEHVGIVDEEPRTPPGQESRLTIAMKHFYLERAHDIHDLPAWLFSERERQVNPKPSIGSHTALVPDSQPERRAPRNAPPPHGQRVEDDVHRSRAATKLRAMADAKRGGVSRTRPLEVLEPAVVPSIRERPRVGLPGASGSSRRVQAG